MAYLSLFRYGRLFLSHIAEDITDSLTFTGDYLFSLVSMPFFVTYVLNFPIFLWSSIIFFNIIFAADGVPKEGLRIQDVLVRLAQLMLIRDKVSSVCLVREF